MSAFFKFQKILALILLGVGLFAGGYYFGARGFAVDIKRNPPQITVENKYPSNQKIDFMLFWQVWDLLRTKYLERPVDGQKMIYGAISGMVNALGDPYTSFLPPVVNKNVTDAINGTYQGIGAELGIKDNQLFVVAPLDGSPAKNSGVQAGDKLLEIEGEATFGLTITQAVAKIRGPSGTFVSLTLQRGDQKPLIVKISRGVVVVSSVTWEDKGDGIAYIRIGRFGTDTDKDWNKAVKELNVKMNELNAVVLDVRQNPGGYLQSAVYLAGEFFTDKPVVYEEDAEGNQRPFLTQRNGAFERLPKIYVLIDSGSASASEILAAALRDNIGAILVGEKTFGKGTIQDSKNFEDGSGLHITIAKWLTPKKVWVHKKGLEPDVPTARSQEDIAKGIDAQLDKALELAKK